MKRQKVDPKEMDMPCKCDNCGDWFDLQNGNPCSDPDDKTVYCTNCVKETWGELKKESK